jgi:hypothetical protein
MPAPQAALSDVNRSTSKQQRRAKTDKDPKKRSYSSHNEGGDKENKVQQMESIQDKLLSNNTGGLVKFSQRAEGHATSLRRFHAPLSQLKNEYDNAESNKKSRKKKALKKAIQKRLQALSLEAGLQTDSGIVKCILEMERKNETTSGNGAPDDENEYMTPPTKKMYAALLAREGDSKLKCEFVAAYRKDLGEAFYQAIITMSATKADVRVESAYTVLAYLDDEANKAELQTESARKRKKNSKGRGGTDLVTKFWGLLVAPVLARISVLIRPRVETKEIKELKQLVNVATGKGKLTEDEVEDYVAKARVIMKQDTIIERSSSTNARQSFTVRPGKLGLTVKLSEQWEGALITAIDYSSCSFANKVEIGDRLVWVDGTPIFQLSDLTVNNTKERQFGIVKKTTIMTELTGGGGASVAPISTGGAGGSVISAVQPAYQQQRMPVQQQQQRQQQQYQQPPAPPAPVVEDDPLNVFGDAPAPAAASAPLPTITADTVITPKGPGGISIVIGLCEQCQARFEFTDQLCAHRSQCESQEVFDSMLARVISLLKQHGRRPGRKWFQGKWVPDIGFPITGNKREYNWIRNRTGLTPTVAPVGGVRKEALENAGFEEEFGFFP